MQKYLLVEVDTNDADYIEKLEPVTEKQLVKLKPLFEAIKSFKPYETADPKISPTYSWKHSNNFPYGEVHRGDLGEKSADELYADHAEALELFCNEFLPYNEYGLHTIKSIRVLAVVGDDRLL